MHRTVCLVAVVLRFSPLFAVEPPSPPTYGVYMVDSWISMKDGVRLAVTLYMPDGAKDGEKFPCGAVERQDGRRVSVG